jgi:Spy/CpxP family protein refolding chaperone
MHKTLLAILAVTSVAATALAADAPATRAPGWNRQAFEQMRAAHAARRADDIALLIGLRPDQRPAFDSFMQTMAPPPRQDRFRQTGDGTPSAGDQGMLARLDAMSAGVDRHDAAAKQRIAAARQFYTSLTPDQQRRFDALDRLRHDHMDDKGMRGGMRGSHRGSRTIAS